MACGLRPLGDGTEVLREEGVEEGGFAHVGCSDEREEARPVRMRFGI